MKITYKTAAQCLLLLTACLPAAAQMEINPDHFPDESSPKISVARHEAEVHTLQLRLEDYERQLRVKSEMVENARQEAISAGIVGDGAGPFIDAYREQQMELEALQAALTPQIERTRAIMAGLRNPDFPAALLSRSRTPSRPTTKTSLIASRDSSKLHAPGR
jgi:hypothetical protein